MEREGLSRAIPIVLAIAAVAATVAAQQSSTDRADALSEAARKGDAAAVKKLLDEGVPVDTKFRYNRTALSFAADRGHAEVVKLLVERGADVNAKDTFYGATPLSWAVNPAMERKPQHAEVVHLLLLHGAQGKENALLGAVSASDAPMTKVILEAGGLPADTLADALEAATRRKQPDIVALLEGAGAKPHIEMKLNDAQLARYVGSYRGTGNMAQATLTISIADGRLAGAITGGPKLTLIARNETTFGVAEQPGTKVTVKIEQDKATMLTVNLGGGVMTFNREP